MIAIYTRPDGGISITGTNANYVVDGLKYVPNDAIHPRYLTDEDREIMEKYGVFRNAWGDVSGGTKIDIDMVQARIIVLRELWNEYNECTKAIDLASFIGDIGNLPKLNMLRDEVVGHVAQLRSFSVQGYNDYEMLDKMKALNAYELEMRIHEHNYLSMPYFKEGMNIVPVDYQGDSTVSDHASYVAGEVSHSYWEL